jgi:Raf kinase inhibitor-like YbhB/YbcL family protein
MQLTSIFEPGEPIPVRYTCDGENVSPPLRWSEAPADTKSFVLIVDDPDAPAGTFVHWVLYDLPGGSRALPERVEGGDAAEGGTQGLNDFDRVGYGGPCPPGGRPHRYVFTLYALDARLGLAPRKRKADVLRAMRGHVLAEAALVGRFQRAARPARPRGPAAGRPGRR